MGVNLTQRQRALPYRIQCVNESFPLWKKKLEGLRKITVLYGDVKDSYIYPMGSMASSYKEVFMLFIDD